jgi:tetratricopeptide (TPR) repeat protein
MAIARVMAVVVALASIGISGQEVFHNPAMEASDEFQKSFARARELMLSARFDEAVTEFRRAAKMKDGKCLECFQMIGATCIQSGKYKDAAAAYRDAINLKPDNEAELHNGLGVAIYLQGEKKLYEEAAAEFRRAIDMSNGRVVKAYYNLGHALLKASKTEDAMTAFKTYLEKQPSAVEASEVRAILANPKAAGQPFAPIFNVKSFKGDLLSLEGLKGKVVLLDFWASWCGPCRAEMPEVKKIWSKYSSDQFIMIGVNLDRDKKAFEAYVREQGLEWPQYFDGGGWNNKVAQAYGVRAIPHTVLIDREGIIRAKGLRGSRLSNAIGDLLKK